jgi:Fe-S cluster assembly protein SufD
MAANEFQQHALSVSASLPATGALFAERRAAAADRFAAFNWPDRKTEAWKYTSLRSLQSLTDAHFAEQASTVTLPEAVKAVESYRLVFVDGVLQSDLSDTLPAFACRFSEASADQKAFIDEKLGTILSTQKESERNLFSYLNDAWLHDGVLLHVPRGQSLDKPLYLVYVSTAENANATLAHQRLLVWLEDDSQANVIEHYLSVSCTANGTPSSDSVNSLTNGISEIFVGKNSRLHHTRLNVEDEAHTHIGGVHLTLSRDSVVNCFALGEGGRLKRIDYQVNHNGTGAEFNMHGAYLARHKQLIDYHTCIEHREPHCTSLEVMRGIIGDKAKAVFNGRIHIHQDAQKTLAELHNRNLLTSNGAEIDTKPELEIYADDVRCAHGATVSQLDETALYYLQSRGIEAAQARMLLSYGFVNEVLEQLPYAPLLESLQARLRDRFIEEARNSAAEKIAGESA